MEENQRTHKKRKRRRNTHEKSKPTRSQCSLSKINGIWSGEQSTERIYFSCLNVRNHHTNNLLIHHTFRGYESSTCGCHWFSHLKPATERWTSIYGKVLHADVYRSRSTSTNLSMLLSVYFFSFVCSLVFDRSYSCSIYVYRVQSGSETGLWCTICESSAIIFHSLRQIDYVHWFRFVYCTIKLWVVFCLL